MGCIYNIINKIDGAIYIGSTVRKNPKKRWWRHTKDLRNNVHHNKFLQRAWNKYGQEAFEFLVIEETNDENILTCEQKHLDYRKSNFPYNLNYNVCWIAGNCQGRKFSPETIRKLKQSHLGIHPSNNTKLKQSLTWDEKCKMTYSFIDASGKIYSDIKNLRRFGREHNLSGQSLKKVHDGKISNHKGWTKTGNKRNVYEITNSNGNKYNVFNLKKFCEEQKINYKVIHKYCIKLNKSYRGWTIVKKSQIGQTG